jgi:predicted nucleic acid-binding protein
LATGVAVLAPCNLQEVFHCANEFSTRYTISGGHRSVDVLHVATAMRLGARDFMTFDGNQGKLAAAVKLKVKP